MSYEDSPVESVAETEVALTRSPRREGPFSPPLLDASKGTALNLARPWRFPAGHVDSILCRRHLRSDVQVPVEIRLYRADGSSYDKGTGVIRDLSYSGARLGDVFLTRGRLLAGHFGIELRPALEPRGGHDIAGRILRTYSSGFPGFGIEFLFPGSGALERLRRMKGVAPALAIGSLPEEPRRRGS